MVLSSPQPVLCPILIGRQSPLAVLEDPAQCHFDPAGLLCKNGDNASCLTGAQVESARAMYGPIKHPKTGRDLSVPAAPAAGTNGCPDPPPLGAH